MLKSKISLKNYNTFNVDVETKFFYPCKSEENLIRFLNFETIKNYPIFVLGSGSNILFVNDFNGIIINLQNKGIKILKEVNNEIYIQVAAGELWDDFVKFCICNSYYGSENLSLIPGTVGASPVQNIGAYGVEAKDLIYKVITVNIKSGKKKIFSNQECKFDYRNSIFKNILKNKYIITKVIFRLSKKKNCKTDYGNIKKELENFEKINLKSIRQAVINIRKRKLPDIKNMPNAGSFFKNPIININKYHVLKHKYPKLISYKINENKVKLAAGQLIEMCGMKEKRTKNVGLCKNQALVIVNIGEANGQEILEFSKKIQHAVYRKFNIKIEREVIVIPEK